MVTTPGRLLSSFLLVHVCIDVSVAAQKRDPFVCSVQYSEN